MTMATMQTGTAATPVRRAPPILWNSLSRREKDIWLNVIDTLVSSRKLPAYAEVALDLGLDHDCDTKGHMPEHVAGALDRAIVAARELMGV